MIDPQLRRHIVRRIATRATFVRYHQSGTRCQFLSGVLLSIGLHLVNNSSAKEAPYVSIKNEPHLTFTHSKPIYGINLMMLN